MKGPDVDQTSGRTFEGLLAMFTLYGTAMGPQSPKFFRQKSPPRKNSLRADCDTRRLTTAPTGTEARQD